jgi:hypothetical protein
MGTYVYAISHSKSRNARLAGGDKVRVNELRYQYKVSWSWDYRRENALGAGRITNMENAWAGERPGYVAFELTDGAEVYRWTGAGISWVDTDALPAEKVGTLRCSTGGRWTVEPLAPEPLVAMDNMAAALAGC